MNDEVDQAPFTLLPSPRSVDDLDLPSGLASFYRTREGVGLEASSFIPVRLCKLAEVCPLRWRDLRDVGDYGPPKGWEDFSAFRIGIDSFFGEITYVVNAPSCQPGSVFAIGTAMNTTGGSGAFAHDGSVVLAGSFTEWLDLLERFGWDDFGLYPDELDELSESDRIEVCQYLRSLNPLIDCYAP